MFNNNVQLKTIVKLLQHINDQLDVLIIRLTEDDVIDETSVAARKKPLRKKLCDICGQEYKGNLGLGIHRSKTHGVRAGNLDKWAGAKERIGATHEPLAKVI